MALTDDGILKDPVTLTMPQVIYWSVVASALDNVSDAIATMVAYNRKAAAETTLGPMDATSYEYTASVLLIIKRLVDAEKPMLKTLTHDAIPKEYLK